MSTIHWRAIAWGLYYLLGMVILLKLFEGMVFSSLPYDSRGVGRFLSRREYVVQEYSSLMLFGYLVVHSVKIAVPSYLTAQIAGKRWMAHASLMVTIGTVLNWLLLQSVFRSPLSELVGFAFSITIACLAAKVCEWHQTP